MSGMPSWPATTLVLGAAYTLWLVKRVIYGEVANDKVAALTDLNGREFLVLCVLAVGGAARRLVAGAAARCDARLDAASGPATAGLEDRSLRIAHERFQCRRFSTRGSASPGRRFSWGWPPACILMLDLLLNDAQRHWTGVLAIGQSAGDRGVDGGAAGVAARSWRWAACSSWTAWRRCSKS